ncbi:MAG: LPS assembly protein LptD [Deltaproteobacteria bacterium]|nr:LPS assembly protein LptD [Deltaproteobacteria bacterium]
MKGQSAFNGGRLFSRVGLLILAAQCIISAYQFIAPVQAQAQTLSGSIKTVMRDADQPWQLEADEINYDQVAGEYTATGNVLIYKENIRLQADNIRFDNKNMLAYAQGNVVLTDGEDILRGTSMEIDLEEQIGSVENGYLFLKQNNYHLTGEVIKKVGAKTYTIDKAILTTCDGPKPDWKVTGKKVEIKPNGDGTARHATMWARKMPVLYTPYFYYPARKKRQTGFLVPQGGTSNRWGTYYNQPFFWAINESSDATFYGHYLDSRGFRGGLEYRYFLDNWSKGTLMANGFDDSKIDDGSGSSSEKWGFDDGDRIILRDNRDRYWFLMSHHQKVPWDLKAKLDVDIVSDQDYTRDFQSGFMGWDKAKDYFLEVFSRDIDDVNDPVRTNQLSFNKSWPAYSLNANLRYDLDSTLRNSDDPNETLQQFPLIEFDALKQRIGESSFFYDLDSAYVYYWSKEADRGQRLDLWPRLFLPLQFKPFFTIEPSVGVRETLYYLDKKKFSPEGDQQFFHREIFDTRLDLFSEIFNVFQTEGKTLEAVKHTIRPRIIHAYTPDLDQDDLPEFDSNDRIVKNHLLTYSLTNTITTKSKKMGQFDETRRVAKTQAEVIGSPADYTYNDFLRFNLVQSYDIEEAREDDPERPFSPITAELDIFPGKYIALDTDAQWSVYSGRFLAHNVKANLWDQRGDTLSVEYRYTGNSKELDQNPSESISANLGVKVTDRLGISANYEYNFLDNTRVSTGYGITYTAQCWSFEGRFTDAIGVDNRRRVNYEIIINLFGLGEFGI